MAVMRVPFDTRISLASSFTEGSSVLGLRRQSATQVRNTRPTLCSWSFAATTTSVSALTNAHHKVSAAASSVLPLSFGSPNTSRRISRRPVASHWNARTSTRRW